MAPEKHALLGASSAHRWINCPPSARLCEALPDTASPYAAEGTQAHAVCEDLIRRTILAETPEPLGFEPTDEMIEASRGYRDYIMGALGTEQAWQICVEQKVDYSAWAPEGFGTVDCLAVTDGALKIFDFKYGQGVPVSAEGNPQMMCYALGGLSMFQSLYDIYSVTMTIYQPRIGNISRWAITVPELLIWARETLEPAARLAYKGEGDQTPGDWCRFCKAKATCRALANQNLELARLDFPEPIGMSNAEIAGILPKVGMLLDWAEAVKGHALDRALRGETIPGYKLVEGRSVRKFRSEADACLKIKQAGYNPYITKMKGLTDLQKEMGKKKFDEVCGDELIKPAGKPALVPVTDKRPEMHLDAAADFAD